MRVAIHLPQYGRVASAEAITRAARHAEELGFAGVFVSDHVVQPADQGYPSPFLFDPLVTLTWAAAVTSQVDLGTSVLVVPQHNPLELANTLASLDNLSGGRVIAGVGVGWSAGEFAALGYDFADRGDRADEALLLWRTVWRDDPASFVGDHTAFADLRVLPKPAHDIPIWVGGSGPRAHRRAVEHGDGFHLIGVTPDEAREPIARLRAERPEDGFTISLRTGWDPQGMEPDRIRREVEEYAAVGVQYVVAAPWRKELDDWLRSMELLAALVGTTTT
ncbi:MAG: LLM class F420-dependent oxidoreductase [Acidimicrobiales bacterium]